MKLRSWIFIMSKFILLFEFFLIGVMFPSISIAQNNELREVVIEGIGRDVAEAAQNAAQNALTNIVGSFIDSKTELEKKIQIQDGVKSLTKSINTDIKEYSQGSIQRFEILKISKANGFFNITAKVVVRVDDFKVYIKKLAEAQTQVNEGLFAQIKIEDKQNKNAAALIYDRILLPLVKGDGIDFSITAPKPLSQMGLSNIDLTRYVQEHSNFSIVGFIVEVKPKINFYNNSLKILDSVGASRVNLGVVKNAWDWESAIINKVHASPKFNYQKDFSVTLIENEPGSKSTDPKSLLAYIIKDAKLEFSKSTAWTGCLMGVVNSCSLDETFYKGHPTPIQTLQLEILGQDGSVLQRERIKGDSDNGVKWNPLGPQNNRMLVLGNSTEHFSSEWSLVGGHFTGGYSLLFVRASNKFIMLVALRDEALKSAKSIVLKLVD